MAWWVVLGQNQMAWNLFFPSQPLSSLGLHPAIAVSASIFDLQIIFAFHSNDLCFYSSSGFGRHRSWVPALLINCVT